MKIDAAEQKIEKLTELLTNAKEKKQSQRELIAIYILANYQELFNEIRRGDFKDLKEKVTQLENTTFEMLEIENETPNIFPLVLKEYLKFALINRHGVNCSRIFC
ncbi:MAG: hypothetical protein K940chlam6_01234 [Chlamydiae bacterium]|nr:hypothetical protein [Chlamydiota bacterium]